MQKLKALCFAALAFCSLEAADILKGEAHIKGLDTASPIIGKVRFEQQDKGMYVVMEIHGMSPGEHGVHIYEFGDLSYNGEAAGGHWNPDGHPHGVTVKDGIDHVHVGDFGNIIVDPQGNGYMDVLIPGMTLVGDKRSIAGRSILFRAGRDHVLTQPDGNPGPAIAGGIIAIVR